MSALLPLFGNLGYLLKIIQISFCYISDYPIDFKGLYLLQITKLIKFSYHFDNVDMTQLNSPFSSLKTYFY